MQMATQTMRNVPNATETQIAYSLDATQITQIRCEWCEQPTEREDCIYVEEVDILMCPECYWQYIAENTERTDLT